MISIQKLRLGLVAFLFLGWAGTPLVWADDSESPWKTFTIKGGVFVPLNDTNLRLNGTGTLNLGTEINLEKDLNLDDEVFSYRIDAEWRFFSRHRLNFSFYDLGRDSTGTLTRTINIGDKTFTFDTDVDVLWDWKVYAASYTWSFLQTNKYEVGLNIGAHITDIKLGVRAQNGLIEEIEEATVPLPVLGLTGAYAFTPKLVLRSNAGVFALKIDKYDGALVNFDLDLEYNLWKYVGFGIGYNFFTMDLEVEEDNFNGKVDYTYHGFKLFLKFYL